MDNTVSTNQIKQMLIKVPEITIYFWIIKLLSTALGESTSDFLVYSINPYIAVLLGAIGFIVSLVLQFKVKRYIAWIYWFAVVMVSIFGTMAADIASNVIGIPYWLSSICFLIALLIIFSLWYGTEKTLSIHSIYTKRREVFYWATVLATFALGTATGDMTASTMHLGYFTSGIVFLILFSIPGVCYWLFGANEIVTFWIAYILTRPFGASFADWFGKSPSIGGLGYGDGLVSAILTILILFFVGYVSITQKDKQEKNSSAKTRLRNPDNV